MLGCKELEKGVYGQQWTLVETKDVTMEQFWAWAEVDYIYGSGDMFLGTYRWNYFEKEVWFELGKSMWRKYISTLQYHVKYIHNDIMKPLRVGILQNAERVRKMHGLAKYLSPPSMKGGDYDHSYWTICNKELSEHEICVVTKYGLPISMQYEFKDKIEDCCFIHHKYWCELLSTMDIKDERKWDTPKIKRLAPSKAWPDSSDRDASMKVPCKNKSRTGVLLYCNHQSNKTPKHHGAHRYGVL